MPSSPVTNTAVRLVVGLGRIVNVAPFRKAPPTLFFSMTREPQVDGGSTVSGATYALRLLELLMFPVKERRYAVAASPPGAARRHACQLSEVQAHLEEEAVR